MNDTTQQQGVAITKGGAKRLEFDVLRPERSDHTSRDDVDSSKRSGIGWAVKHLWNGRKVARDGWNGPNQYLKINWPAAPGHDTNLEKMTLPFVYITTEDGSRVPWLCSQNDLLAADWRVIS